MRYISGQDGCLTICDKIAVFLIDSVPLAQGERKPSILLKSLVNYGVEVFSGAFLLPCIT